MSLISRRELIASVAVRYGQASREEQHQILTQFVAATGYHRKYAIALLNHPPSLEGISVRERRPRQYGQEVEAALIELWEVANRICSKRLVPFLPALIEAVEGHGHLELSTEVREKLLSISPTTVDRLLHRVRLGTSAGGLSTTRRGRLLKHQIPIWTFAEWDEVKPGFFEADLVAHCGGSLTGSYLYSLVLTDVASVFARSTRASDSGALSNRYCLIKKVVELGGIRVECSLTPSRPTPGQPSSPRGRDS